MAAVPPVLHILAGPNGAGKTSLYQSAIREFTNAEFVNADELSFNALGRHAQNQADAELGQALANARRDALLAAGVSLVTESTFSHPSKLDLVERARASGYVVIVYHLNLESADDAVARVAARLAQGGHPVPESKIRGRYERNQPLIREAVRGADRGFVFDNSVLARPARRLITFAHGHPIDVAPDLPAWAKALYGEDLV
ncbi:MAG: hypothetical protein JWQ29_1189 [Phenylobacterium sp.]|nr:hypothetical protein [Phenylobacterium sp.]